MVVYSVSVSRLMLRGQIYNKGDFILSDTIPSYLAAVRSKALQLILIEDDYLEKVTEAEGKVRDAQRPYESWIRGTMVE